MQAGAEAPAPGLAGRLRTDTRTLHTALERSAFMQALLRGTLGRAHYCLFLRSLHPIYDALETALRACAGNALVAPVLFPALFRATALEQDLRALHGRNWRAELPVQPASRQYVQRLQVLQRTDGALLVAHAYVRYLGDLSGGQLLKRIVAQGPALDADSGTCFYDFGEAQQTTALVRAFRDGLQQVTSDASQVDRIVAEALRSFALHGDLFQQLALAAGLPGAPALTTP